ncbi:MAG: PAS domain S-box protein [Proteobacteria bacterium]|nr:PAS domain S-box protein [Pseudomonadota bacterium]
MRLPLFSRLGIRFSIVQVLILLVSVAIMVAVAVNQIRVFGSYAVEQNRASFLEQAEKHLGDVARERALHLHAVFRQAEIQTASIARRVEQVLSKRDFYARENFNPGESFSLDPRNRIFTNQPRSLASCVYWGRSALSPEITADMTALSHLDPLLEEVQRSVPGAAAAWLITSNAIARYYPNIHHVDLMPPVQEYDYHDDLCYLLATPEHNPEKKVAWHEVYQDSMGQGLVITVSAPAYSEAGEFLASAGIDISLDAILREVVTPETAGRNDFSFVLDRGGQIIAFPLDQLDAFGLETSGAEGQLLEYNLSASTIPEVRAVVNRMLQHRPGSARLFLGCEEYILAYHPMGELGWTFGHVEPMTEVLASVRRTQLGIGASLDVVVGRFFWVALAVLACTLGAILLFFTFSLFRPMSRLTATVRRVSAGDLEARSGVRRRDELGELALAVDEMAAEIQEQRHCLLEARENYRELFEGATSGLYRTTVEGKLLSANRAFAHMFGCESVDEFHAWATDVREVMYANPLDRDRFITAIQEQNELHDYEIRGRRRDGAEFWATTTVRTVRDSEGAISYYEGSAVDISDRKRVEEYQARLSQELIRIQEAERRGLALELHDNLAQDLSALKISFEMLLDDQADVDPATRRRAENCSELLRRCIVGVRGMAQGLGPFGLEELGLKGVLREYCSRFAEASGVAMDFNAAGLVGVDLPVDVLVHLFRIVQEALNNVRAHSRARSVTVRLVTSHPNLILRVEDDGVGFNGVASSEQSLGSVRMGLVSIRERGRLLGGRAEIDSVPGRGTRVLVEIPLSSVRHIDDGDSMG